MKLLVAIACLALAEAAPLLGGERCTWGPSYWCSSLDTARECRATAHCVQNVWGAQAPPTTTAEPLKDGLCTFCKFVVTEAAKLAEANATETKIESFLDQACRIIPDQGLQSECKKAVDAFTPEIIQLIFDELSPDAVCSAIALCTSQEQTHEKQEKVGDACSDCQAAAQKLIDFVSENTTETEIEKFLNETLCDQLGGLDDLCKQIVMSYVPQIVDLLKNDVDPDTICQLIGFCSSQLQAAAAKLKTPAVDAGPECILCEFVMKELESLVTKNSSETEIVKALDTVCSLLPSSINGECQSFVNEYAPAIITLLVNEFDPKAICTVLTMCAAEKRPEVGAGVCDMCQYVVTYLDGLLQTNRSEAAVERALEQVCNFLPENLKNQCSGLVEQYGPAIVQLLAQLVDPNKICSELNLCSDVSSLNGLAAPALFRQRVAANGQ